MSDGFKVEITDLYLTAPAFTRAGGAITDAVTQAQSQLAGLGAFWGNDAPGQQFASFYVKDSNELLGLLNTVGGEIEGIADGINQMASNYGVTEEANVAKIMQLEQEEGF